MSENLIEQSILQRRSVRAYLPDVVDRSTIEAILKCTRQAPSGANLQPGQFHVLTGDALAKLKNQLSLAVADNRPVVTEYSYFPPALSAELKARQRAAGYALYKALGIEKRDTKGRREQFSRNYQFFDAPVGVVVCIDQDMGKGCFMDLGMALMNFFVSAHSRGLGTSGIGALANYADVVHECLELPADEMVVCGIALGFADTTNPVNAVETTREPVDAFARFYGFDS